MKKFKTESKRLLDLMINSIYTNQEIFLRELISNASDALDKLYIRALTDKSVAITRSELGIQIAFDKDARTITISDNGIGMSQEDMDKNLGTIAHSGSLEFKNDLATNMPEVFKNADKDADNADADAAAVDADADATAVDAAGAAGATETTAKKADTAGSTSEQSAADIIGQFGVGFYSGFMVASKVSVVSRTLDASDASRWESEGVDGYTIKSASRSEHGSDIILTLKSDTDDNNYSHFLSEYELRSLVKKYSNYVRYPIRMMVSKQRELPKPSDAGDDYKPTFESYQEIETLNSMVPIWKRRRSDVSLEDYNEFYKSNFHDYMDAACNFSIKAEGALNYDALLFIPSQAPFDLYSTDFEKGLSLYSSNVMIMEKCSDLLSDHFNFVRGVVDSSDLDLNISRETLQKNHQLTAIAKRIEKKICQELSNMLENDREKYEQVFSHFGRNIKYGIYTSYGMQKETLAPLLLYYSAKEQKQVTLREYLDAAPSNQEAIYYAAGEDTDQLAKMPMVKSVIKRGFDVLLCVQEIDDFCFSVINSYDDKPLKNVAGTDLGLESESEKQEAKEQSEKYEALFGEMKEILADKVTKVTLSNRLVDMPAGISAAGAVSLEMEKVLAAMPDARDIRSERVLELNFKHPVFKRLVATLENDKPQLALLTKVLYNQALMIEGLPVADPIDFAESIAELLS